jgi:hypothetical protein
MSISGDNPFGYGSQAFKDAINGFRAQNGITQPAASQSAGPPPAHLEPILRQRFSAYLNAHGGSPAPVPAAQVDALDAGIKDGQWVAYSVAMPQFGPGPCKVYVPAFEKNNPVEFYVRASGMDGTVHYGPIFTLRDRGY